MSIIQVVHNTLEGTVPIGTSVVISDKNIIAYDNSIHTTDQIVGVVFSKDAMYGRELVNGLVFYENDTFEVDDFFNYKLDEYGEYIYNATDPKVDPWTDPNCIFVLTRGFAPVLKGQYVNPTWVLYSDTFSTITDIYWVR